MPARSVPSNHRHVHYEDVDGTADVVDTGRTAALSADVVAAGWAVDTGSTASRADDEVGPAVPTAAVVVGPLGAGPGTKGSGPRPQPATATTATIINRDVLDKYGFTTGTGSTGFARSTRARGGT